MVIYHSSFSTDKSFSTDVTLYVPWRFIRSPLLYIRYHVSVYIYYYHLHRRFIYSTSRFVFPFDLFFFSSFRTKESNIKTSSNKGEEWKARNYRQCITNETRCWIYTIVANTYSLLPTSPRRDIAALPSNRMRWCILDCVYRIPATERKESLQRSSLYTFPFIIIIIITLLQI